MRNECVEREKKSAHIAFVPFIDASFRFNNPMITMQSDVCYEFNKITIKIIAFCGLPS